MPTRAAVIDLIERGMCPAVAGDMVLRMLPPLIIEDEHLDEAIEKLDDALTDWREKGLPA